jgi:hypothetical protein
VAPSPEAEPAFEEQPAPVAEQPPVPAPAPVPAEEVPAHSETPEWNEDSPFPPPAAEKRRSARKPAAKKPRAQVTDDNIGNVAEAVDVAQVDGNVEAAPAKAARKSPARGRRPAKSKE